MDAEVARVLDVLTRLGLREDTIVVFTSDNGGERFSYNWPFSGQKTELLEGGLRVPALLSWPSALPCGVINDQPTITMDWLPTLLAAAGTVPAADYPPDGIDLLPLVHDGKPVPRDFYWRFKSNGQRAMRRGPHKYLRIRDEEYLFDLEADPRERANLKDRMPARFGELKRSWLAWNETMLAETRDSFTEGVTAADQADHIGAGSFDDVP
jgi:arylsulfatase A-like enzyme